MSLDVTLIDRNGNPQKTIDGGIACVADDGLPILNLPFTAAPFRQRFRDANGSDDLRVDGSATPIWFNLLAQAEQTFFIKTIQIFIQDSGAALEEFGNLSALTNGVKFEYFTDEFGLDVIDEGMKTNLDLVRLSGGMPQIGQGNSAFKADVANAGGGDAYLPLIDLQMIFGFQRGLPIRQGSNDRLSFVVQDDLSVGITEFNIQATGIKRDLRAI